MLKWLACRALGEGEYIKKFNSEIQTGQAVEIVSPETQIGNSREQQVEEIRVGMMRWRT